MNAGSVVTMSNCNIKNGSFTYGYKARKGEMLVFIFLGKEPKDGSAPLDVDEVLKSMGWEYVPSIPPKDTNVEPGRGKEGE